LGKVSDYLSIAPSIDGKTNIIKNMAKYKGIGDLSGKAGNLIFVKQTDQLAQRKS
jgi:hypothetical protein